MIPKAGADFVCSMESVLEVYQRPYDPTNPVVNLDESPKQLIGEVKQKFIDKKGVEYFDYEYQRNGVADLIMIAEPKAGKRKVLVRDNHNRITYAKVIQHIADEMYPKAKKITLIEDNLSSHKLSALYEIMDPAKARAMIERFEIVRTPKHGSWLNIAELELSIITRQGLTKRVGSKPELERQVKNWYEVRNKKTSKVNWQFQSKDARIKLKTLYPKFDC